MKRFTQLNPYLFCFLSILISIVIWDFLKLNYDVNNIIQGAAYDEKINPLNNTLRVLFFIFFPLIIFLIFFLRNKNLLSINPLNPNFFLTDGKELFETNAPHNKIENKNAVNFLTLIFVLLCLLEFYSLDFSKLLQPIDIYHDGLILVPPLNFYEIKKFWLSIHFDYGIGGNLRPILIWKLLGLETIGAARFFDQSIILLNKILIIFVCRKLSIIIRIKDKISIIFYFILTLASIQLTDYFISLTGTGGSEFPLRLSLFLIFYLFLIDNIYAGNNFFKNFFLGLFSSFSFLWFTDIAFYINGVLVIYLFILLFNKSHKEILYTIFGIISSWIIFLFTFGLNEVNQMFFQISANLKFIYYLNFIEFPKPLSEHSASSRALKSMLLIIINGILLLNLCLNKKFNINYKSKLVLLITFACSLIVFKSALVRSDQYHLKYTLGFILLLFFIQTFYLFVMYQNLIIKKINTDKIQRKFLFLGLIVFTTSFFIFSNKIQLNKIINNYKSEIFYLLKKEDDHFLDFKVGMFNYGRVYNVENISDDKKFIQFYKDLTKEDKCVQNFTEYLGLAYFLKKPTCTTFYNAQFIQHNFTDKKFLDEFRLNLPNFILYKAPMILQYTSKTSELGTKGDTNKLLKGAPDVEKFLQKNYSFYISYLDNWIIYKKKN